MDTIFYNGKVYTMEPGWDPQTAGAVQDGISGDAKSELFAGIQKCVTGQMSAEEAVTAAIRLNEEP